MQQPKLDYVTILNAQLTTPKKHSNGRQDGEVVIILDVEHSTDIQTFTLPKVQRKTVPPTEVQRLSHIKH